MSDWQTIAKEFAPPGGAYMDAAATECVQRMAEEIARLRADLESWHKGAVAGELSLVRAELAECESERLEQARLNGMGAERELALQAKLEAAERERDEALRGIKGYQGHCEAFRAKLAAAERELQAFHALGYEPVRLKILLEERDAAHEECDAAGAAYKMALASRNDARAERDAAIKALSDEKWVREQIAAERDMFLKDRDAARVENARLYGILTGHHEGCSYAASMMVCNKCGYTSSRALSSSPDSSADLAAVKGAMEALGDSIAAYQSTFKNLNLDEKTKWNEKVRGAQDALAALKERFQ